MITTTNSPNALNRAAHVTGVPVRADGPDPLPRTRLAHQTVHCGSTMTSPQKPAGHAYLYYNKLSSAPNL